MSEQISVPISRRLYDRARRLAELRRRDVQEVIEQTPYKAIATELSAEDRGWEMLIEVIDSNRMDTGILDLAEQHDHYLYGVPKRDLTNE